MGLERFSSFIPYDVFVVETPYTPEEVAERVQSLIAERPVMNIKELIKSANPFRYVTSPPLLGNVMPGSFEVYSKPSGRATPPHFYGTIMPTSYGSIVKVRMQYQPVVLLRLGIGAGFLVLVLIGIFDFVLSGNYKDAVGLMRPGYSYSLCMPH